MYDWTTFDPAEAAEAVSGALPEGEYLVMAKNPRWMDTRSGTGRIFYLSFEVIDGEHKGWSTDLGFNLVNQNETAVRIARGELGKICLASGMTGNPNSEADFVNRTLRLTVKVEDYNGRKSNRFVGARPNTAGAAVPVPSAPAAPSNGGNGKKKLPWQK